MKVRSWSSCSDGCGGGDEEELMEVLALVKRSEKRNEMEKEKYL